MKSDGAVIIDTRLNSEKIETDFKKLDKQTKNMINKYNKSVDSIKKQELALDKVKQKLDDIENGGKVPPSIKATEKELNSVNKELELFDKKANEISSRQETLSFQVESEKSLGDLGNSEVIKQSELEIQKLDNEMQQLATQEETAKLRAEELVNKLSELKNNNPETEQLKQQISNMTSSLEESKKQTNELGQSIKKNLGFKAKLTGITGFDELGTKIDKFKTKMTKLIGTVAVFSLIRKGLTSLRDGFTSLLKQNDGFNNSLNQIKANLMTAFAPIYNAVLPAINSLMNALSKITGTIAVFVSGLFGKSLGDAKKQAQGLSKSLEDVGKSGEEASGGLSSFDHLEVIGGDTSSRGSSGSGSSGIDYSGEITYSQKLLDILNKIKDFVVDNKELIIGFIGGITGALIALKILGLDPIKSLGIGLIIAGIIILIQGIVNFIKDPSWENFGTILTGLAVILAGVAVAMLAVNAANPVAWIVLAIAAIVALGAIIIKNWDSIKEVLSKVWDWINEKVVEPIKNGFNSAGEFLKEKWTKVKEFFSGLWQGMKDGAKGAWEGIKNIFSTVASFFKNIFTDAWSGVKKVFSTGGKIFDGIKEGILSGFKAIVNAIIGGINKVVSVPFNGINWALQKIRDIEFLGISPFKNIIKTINVPQIPKLAKGTVIPPRSEFMAILGDQKRGVNIEAPLETIKDGVRDVLAEMGLNSTEKEIVIENLTIINRMGTTDFSKSVVKGVRIAEKNLGKPLFVN